MNENKKAGAVAWTAKYTLLNAAYFVAFCTIHAYAAVFLLANGFIAMTRLPHHVTENN